MLSLQTVSVRIGPTPLLRDVSTSFESGQLVAIVGPNGAGKSTLIKVISGELGTSVGRVVLHGSNVSDFAAGELAHLRAVVPQSTQLAFPFSVREVAQLGMMQSSRTKSERDAVCNEALAALDLLDISDRSYMVLSGGEKQRTHLARAWCQLQSAADASLPKMLLLDEATANLDIAHQLTVLKFVKDLTVNGTLVIAVLHDLNLAAAFADRLVLMNGGKVVTVGAPPTVIERTTLSGVFQCDVRPNVISLNSPFVLPQCCSATKGLS